MIIIHIGAFYDMKKIGIITEYYNSRNYGGVYQAYALK